jgi:riboflavin biosynthesis pyrimidine reductase
MLDPDGEPVLRRLYPSPAADVTAAAAYADDRRGRHHGRPWVIITMIASVDGATALAGRSGGLGNRTDQAVFHAVRNLADVVLVGAGTARAEHYGPPAKAGQRVAVVTGSGRIDPDSRLFASGVGLVVTTEDAPDPGVEAIRAGRGGVDLAAALRRLDAEVVACEGGPTLNGGLLAAGCVDEWCVTTAPILVAGPSRRAAVGPDEARTDMRLAHVLETDGFLYCRYVRA